MRVESVEAAMRSNVVKHGETFSLLEDLIIEVTTNEIRKTKPIVFYLEGSWGGRKDSLTLDDLIVMSNYKTLIENKSLMPADLNQTDNKKIHVGEHCVPAASWQITSYPTCNNIHEIDMTMQKDGIDYLGKGHHRDVWKVDHSNFKTSDEVALKTLRLYRDFVANNYEMHRIDAMVAERLSFSSYVVDIHGFCGQSAINELGLGDGTRAHRIFKKKEYNSLLKLRLAYGVARGIADMQIIDEALGTTVLHLDIGAANVLITKDMRMKLNDFNSAFLLHYDEVSGEMCGMKFEKRCGTTDRRADLRSPEECRGEVLSGKSDAYSIGPIIFRLLSGVRMYHYGEQEKIGNNYTIMREIISEGKVPPLLPSNIIKSDDPATKYLLAVMSKSLTNDPDERPSAAELAELLAKEIDRITQ